MSHILTLIPHEHGLALAEVRAHRAGAEVVRSSMLALAQPLESPGQSGEALAQYLAEQGYTARRVVVGLPAGRVLARHKLLPQPPSEPQLQDMLRLAIERELTGAGRGLRVDYWKQPTDDGKVNVLLVAAADDLLARLEAMVAAAKLHLYAVMPTLVAIAADDPAPSATSDRSLLLVDDDGADLLLRSEHGPMGLTRVSMDEARHTHALADAVMRTLAGAPQATPRLEVLCELASERAAGELADGLSEWGEVAGPRTVSPPLALARCALAGDASAVDLAHHKLGGDPEGARRRRRRMGALVATCVVLLGVLAGVAWQQAIAPVAALEREYELIREEAEQVQAVRERALAAEPWLSPQPVHLGCLWDLARLFPEGERVWVSHLRLRTGDVGAIQCRAGSRQVMLELFAAMEETPAFEDVALRDWQEVDANAGGVRFEITFRHVGDAPAVANQSEGR